MSAKVTFIRKLIHILRRWMGYAPAERQDAPANVREKRQPCDNGVFAI